MLSLFSSSLQSALYQFLASSEVSFGSSRVSSPTSFECSHFYGVMFIDALVVCIIICNALVVCITFCNPINFAAECPTP